MSPTSATYGVIGQIYYALSTAPILCLIYLYTYARFYATPQSIMLYSNNVQFNNEPAKSLTVKCQ